MKCKTCGENIPNGHPFCGNCGTAADKKGPKRKGMIIGGVAAAAVIALAVILVLLCSPKTIVLDNYIEVKVSGYDTVGTATLEWDREQLVEDMLESMSRSKQKKLEELIDDLSTEEKLALALLSADTDADEEELLVFWVIAQELELELDETEDLSNGDTVTLELDVDEDFFKELGLKVKLKKTVYPVEGLKEATKVDPFDYLEISYEGYAPQAQLILRNTAEDGFLMNHLSFWAENCENINEGDEITVTASFDEWYAIENGYIFTQTTRQITATNVPQPQKIDVFDLLTVTYTGVDGSGMLYSEVAQTEDYFLSSVSFRFDKISGLSEGDTVLCTATWWADPTSNGYEVEATEMTFTVPELGTYVTDYTALSEATRQQLMDAALAGIADTFDQDAVFGYLYTGESVFDVAYDYDDYSSFGNFRIDRAFYGKYNSWGTISNRVGFVITFDLSGHSVSEANTTGYCCVIFRDLILTPDGTLEEGWEDNAIFETLSYTSYDLFYSNYLQYMIDLVVTDN